MEEWVGAFWDRWITQTARRRWLQRVAGANERVAHAALDHETLRLPPQIAVLRTQDLNRDLYLWLAAPTGGSADRLPHLYSQLTGNQCTKPRPVLPAQDNP